MSQQTKTETKPAEPKSQPRKGLNKTKGQLKPGEKHKFVKNEAKIAALKKAVSVVRTGGKGSVRRKQKRVRKNMSADDVKVQQQIRKLGCNTIPDVDEVNMFMEDDSILHFVKPKVQAATQSNTYVVSGKYEKKTLSELLKESPSIISQLGANDLSQLKNIAQTLKQETEKKEKQDDDEIPELESFEQPQQKTEEKKEEEKKPEEQKPEKKKPEEQKTEEKKA